MTRFVRRGTESRWAAMGLMGLTLVLPAVAGAQGEGAPNAAEPPPELTARGVDRSRVVIGYVGALDATQRTALVDLLGVELASHEPRRELELQAAAGQLWLEQARRDRRALLIVLLELRASGTWKLYLVDAARSRAIVRELPGEGMGNSAALETIASVVSSAVRALDEGLEIASQPVANVFAEVRPRPAPAPKISAAAPPGVRLGGSLAGALASFEDSAVVTAGLSAGLRLSLPSALVFEFGVAPYWPARFESEFGNFELQRTQAFLLLGAEISRGAWEFGFETGATLELLLRRTVHVEPGAAAREDTALLRAGGALMLSCRYRTGKRLALELVLGGAYFPQRIRYTLFPVAERELASPWPWMGLLQLGLEYTLVQ